MSFEIAFDKNENLEFMIYRDMKVNDNIFYSEPIFKKHIAPIGTFLLMFLNTNFENESECASFICNFCFESLYYRKYPEKKEDSTLSFIKLSLSPKEFITELKELVKDEQEYFLYVKNIFLENLNLPYNEELLKSVEENAKRENENVNPEILQQSEKLKQDCLEYCSKREEERKQKLNYLKENYNDLYLEALEKRNKRIEKNKQL